MYGVTFHVRLSVVGVLAGRQGRLGLRVGSDQRRAPSTSRGVSGPGGLPLLLLGPVGTAPRDRRCRRRPAVVALGTVGMGPVHLVRVALWWVFPWVSLLGCGEALVLSHLLCLCLPDPPPRPTGHIPRSPCPDPCTPRMPVGSLQPCSGPWEWWPRPLVCLRASPVVMHPAPTPLPQPLLSSSMLQAGLQMLVLGEAGGPEAGSQDPQCPLAR